MKRFLAVVAVLVVGLGSLTLFSRREGATGKAEEATSASTVPISGGSEARAHPPQAAERATTNVVPGSVVVNLAVPLTDEEMKAALDLAESGDGKITAALDDYQEKLKRAQVAESVRSLLQNPKLVAQTKELELKSSAELRRVKAKLDEARRAVQSLLQQRQHEADVVRK